MALAMPQDLTTGFIGRLRARDPQAWFELWETFGPVIGAQLRRWGRGRIGHETVQDLSQETLAALSQAIDTHDPSRGVRFSTWLLAIARYTLSDEVDRRMAQKRNSGQRPVELDEALAPRADTPGPDEDYHRLVLGAKVDAAVRQLERESDFVDFAVFRLRVLEGQTGAQVGEALGMSEATVSRRLARLRQGLRAHLSDVFARYSFGSEDEAEIERNGLDPSPNKASDALFDEAVGEVHRRYQVLRAAMDDGEGG
jgi:RNA polymerase sigma factor (sigma-70 family)